MTNDDTPAGIDVVLVTGLSGAGRGTAAKVLEDLGWYVADNLPPQLITRMVDFLLSLTGVYTYSHMQKQTQSSHAFHW